MHLGRCSGLHPRALSGCSGLHLRYCPLAVHSRLVNVDVIVFSDDGEEVTGFEGVDGVDGLTAAQACTADDEFSGFAVLAVDDVVQGYGCAGLTEPPTMRHDDDVSL